MYCCVHKVFRGDEQVLDCYGIDFGRFFTGNFADLQLVAHPVHFLNVGENHFRIYSLISHHSFHVVGSEEVRNASESSLVILQRSIHFLDVGKDDLGVESAGRDHVVHIVSRNEIGDPSVPLSSLKG